MHRPRAIRGNRAVLGTMYEHDRWPIWRDEQLREYIAVCWRQCIRELSRGKVRAQRAAKRGLVRAGPVVEIGALLQPQTRELHARVRWEARRGVVGAMVRQGGLCGLGQQRAGGVKECGELRGIQYLVAQEKWLGLRNEEVRGLR